MHHVQNHCWRGGVGCECDFLFRSTVAAQHKQRFYSSQSTCSQTATVAQVPALLAQKKITVLYLIFGRYRLVCEHGCC